MTAVAIDQRFKKSRPCPICAGGHDMPQWQGIRCHGFLSSDGLYAHCSRKEYAVQLAIGPDGLYAHRLNGDCRCGANHSAGATPAAVANHQNGHQPNGQAKGEPFAIYDYGSHEKARFHLPDGSKFFAWRRKGATGWKGESGAVMSEMPLYGADLLASRPDDDVLFVEGEECAKALRTAGYLAVTSAGGAKQTNFGKDA